MKLMLSFCFHINKLSFYMMGSISNGRQDDWPGDVQRSLE